MKHVPGHFILDNQALIHCGNSIIKRSRSVNKVNETKGYRLARVDAESIKLKLIKIELNRKPADLNIKQYTPDSTGINIPAHHELNQV